MRSAFLLAILAASPSVAQSYDGLYRPDADWAAGWNCRIVGSDGGVLAVQDGMFIGIDGECRLENPVAVRGLPATLYDAQCVAEGESVAERLMLLRTEEGLAVVRADGVILLRRCP